MTLGERILETRQKLDMTQQELSSQLDLTPQYVSAIEKNRKIPSLMQTVRIAQALGVTVDYLVHGGETGARDTVSSIKGDERLSLRAKKALLSLLDELYHRPENNDSLTLP